MASDAYRVTRTFGSGGIYTQHVTVTLCAAHLMLVPEPSSVTPDDAPCELCIPSEESPNE